MESRLEEGRMMEEEEVVVFEEGWGGERGRCLRQSPSHDGLPGLGL